MTVKRNAPQHPWKPQHPWEIVTSARVARVSIWSPPLAHGGSFSLDITGTWPEGQASDVIEVIVMTTSQRHRPDSSAPCLRALGRSARKLYHEQMYAWERYFRAGLPSRAGEPAPRVPTESR
jgi:hypothetical protein